MADYSQFRVDLDTPHPGGGRGASPRSAFTRFNDFLSKIGVDVGGLIDSLALTALKGGTSTQRFKVAPAVDNDDAVQRSQLYGVGQSPQDVTASRAINLAYTNATGKMIHVFVEATTTNAAAALQARSAGRLCATSSYPTAGATIGINFPVPPGATYAVYMSSGTITGWTEYR